MPQFIRYLIPFLFFAAFNARADQFNVQECLKVAVTPSEQERCHKRAFKKILKTGDFGACMKFASSATEQERCRKQELKRILKKDND